MNCSAEAPLPPRFPRDIPDETVKALAFCLVINHLLGRDDNYCHCYAFLPLDLHCYYCHFLLATFFYGTRRSGQSPESQAASVWVPPA